MKETGGGYQSGAVSPQEATSDKDEKESPAKLSEQFMFRNELLNRTYKFLGQINTTIQQLQIQGLFALFFFNLS